MKIQIFTPELIEETNQNLLQLWAPEFIKIKEGIISYIIETTLQEKINHAILVIVIFYATTRFLNFWHEFNEKHNIFR